MQEAAQEEKMVQQVREQISARSQESSLQETCPENMRGIEHIERDRTRSHRLSKAKTPIGPRIRPSSIQPNRPTNPTIQTIDESLAGTLITQDATDAPDIQLMKTQEPVNRKLVFRHTKPPSDHPIYRPVSQPKGITSNAMVIRPAQQNDTSSYQCTHQRSNRWCHQISDTLISMDILPNELPKPINGQVNHLLTSRKTNKSQNRSTDQHFGTPSPTYLYSKRSGFTSHSTSQPASQSHPINPSTAQPLASGSHILFPVLCASLT